MYLHYTPHAFTLILTYTYAILHIHVYNTPHVSHKATHQWSRWGDFYPLDCHILFQGHIFLAYCTFKAAMNHMTRLLAMVVILSDDKII